MRKPAIVEPRNEFTTMKPGSENRRITGEKNVGTRRNAINKRNAILNIDVTNITTIMMFSMKSSMGIIQTAAIC